MIELNELYRYFLQYPRISTDTRKDLKDSLFFSLSGENFNGNRFAGEALDKGAKYALIDDPAFDTGEHTILVQDTLTTLQELATLHRQNSSAAVIGITGTNGKTTTKELIASVLQTSKNIIFTTGNFNNHIGVPLSVLNIKKDTEIAVIEMGANHIGEIANLCEIAQPETGIITNIGKAHLEGFGSYEGVITAKSELYNYLRKNNFNIIVNGDDPLLMQLSDGVSRFTYGNMHTDVTAQITDYQPGLSINWTYQGSQHHCKTNLYGKYNLPNILAAIAAGIYYGLHPHEINQGIAGYVSENNRSQQLKTAFNNIFLDAYNANPVSMREAINSFKEYASNNPWLILGDMFELGEVAEEEHLEIISLLEKTEFTNMLLVGNEFFNLKEKTDIPVFRTTDELGRYLKDHKISDADILIKGSRGMQLEKLLTQL